MGQNSTKSLLNLEQNSILKLKSLLLLDETADNNFGEIHLIDYDSFIRGMKIALTSRKRSFKRIQQFVRTNCAKLSLSLFNYLDDYFYFDYLIKPPVAIIAIMGQVNSGKSLLVSQLLNRDIVMPTSEEPTTALVTRLVYSKKFVLRIFQLRDDIGTYKETLIKTIDNPTNEQLDEIINIPHDKRIDSKAINRVIEIGLPNKLLKCGVHILDCPGLDETAELSKKEMDILECLNISLIIYVYDYLKGFSMKDGERLDRIKNGLQNERSQSVQFVLIANKVDQLQENDILDTPINANELFDINEATRSIIDNCQFKKSNWRLSNKHLVRFDKSALLPVIPLSTGMLYVLHNHQFREQLEQMLNNDDVKEQQQSLEANIYIKMFQVVQQLIIKKLTNQPLLLCNIVAEEVHNFNSIRDADDEMKCKIWLIMKTLSIDRELLQSIITQCCCTSPDNQYGGYKVYSCSHNWENIQVTTLTNTDHYNGSIDFNMELINIFRCQFMCKLLNFKSTKYYYHHSLEDQTAVLYMIEQGAPNRRLMDHLDEFSLHNLETFVHQAAKLYAFNTVALFPTNFRADCLYYDDNSLGKLQLNRHIPNNPNLPFLMKDQVAVKPFHLHPQTSQLYGQFGEKWSPLMCLVEHIYSFGWFVWLTIEGSGRKIPNNQEDPIDQLKHGRFPKYPHYLKTVMKKCWAVHWPNIQQENSNLHQLEESTIDSWNGIVKLIKYNFWIRDQSMLVHDLGLIEYIIHQWKSNPDLEIFKFSKDYEQFFINYKNQSFLITIINNCLREKSRLYHDRKKQNYLRDEYYIYETDDEINRIIIVDMHPLPYRLIDKIDKFSVKQIENCITKIVTNQCKTINFIMRNFRLDNIFVNQTFDKFYVNYNIPNSSQLPFLIKNNGQLTESFHLPAVCINQIRKYNTYGAVTAEFIFNFGWFVWILLRGGDIGSSEVVNDSFSPDAWINSLLTKGVKNYPQYLNDVMTQCWNVKTERVKYVGSEHDCYRDWQKIVNLILRNNEIAL